MKIVSHLRPGPSVRPFDPFASTKIQGALFRIDCQKGWLLPTVVVATEINFRNKPLGTETKAMLWPEITPFPDPLWDAKRKVVLALA